MNRRYGERGLSRKVDSNSGASQEDFSFLLDDRRRQASSKDQRRCYRRGTKMTFWLCAALLSIISLEAVLLYAHFSTNLITLRQERMNGANIPHGLLCNMDSCFNFSKCSGTDSVYIYPDDAGLEGHLHDLSIETYNRIHGDFKREISDPLRNNTMSGVHITDDPQNACLFIVPGLCYEGNRCDTWEGFIPSRLKALPYWEEYGRNHVIFDTDDSPATKFSSLDAITIQTAAHDSFFRHGFDVEMLLYGKMNLRKRWVNTNTDEYMKRSLLMSFKGAGSHPIRARLFNIFEQQKHDNVKVLVRELMSTEAYNAEDYSKLLLASRFALVPRGRGTHIHRLMEALSAGCIPIIISDGYILPTFDDASIDWRSFSLRFAESEIDTILPFLLSMETSIIREMHENVRSIYPILEQGTHLFRGVPLILERIRKRRAYSNMTRPS